MSHVWAIHLGAAAGAVAQADVTALRRAAMTLTGSVGDAPGLDLVVACCPGAGEEAHPDVVVGPADAAARATLGLALAAGGLVDFQVEGAGRAGQAGEDTGTAGPPDRVAGADGEEGAVALLQRGRLAFHGGQHVVDVLGHVWVVGVERLRVRGLGHCDGLFFVAVGVGRVEAVEPCCGRGVVAGVSDVDVEWGHVAFGLWEVVLGRMGDDEAIAGIDRLGSDAGNLGEPENKTGSDSGQEHCGREWLEWTWLLNFVVG